MKTKRSEEERYYMCCVIISKVSGSKKGSSRSRRMESYKQNRNGINLLHSRPLYRRRIFNGRLTVYTSEYANI